MDNSFSIVLVCIATLSMMAIIFPFRPFRTRLIALVVCFWATILQLVTQEVILQRTASNQAAEVNNKQIILEEKLKPETETKSPKEPHPDTVSLLEAALKRNDFYTAKAILKTLQRVHPDLGSAKERIERIALEQVKPIPSSNQNANLQGYEFLFALNPENQLYFKKVASYKEQITQKRESAITKMRTKEDRIEGVTWFKHPQQPRYTNSRSTVYLYIGQKTAGGQPWLRMVVQYTASDWLFVDHVTAWHDGTKNTLVAQEFERDNNSTIWEWVDVTPSSIQIEQLKKIATAKESILRFEGDKYHRDIILSGADKRAILDVLLAYDVLMFGP